MRDCIACISTSPFMLASTAYPFTFSSPCVWHGVRRTHRQARSLLRLLPTTVMVGVGARRCASTPVGKGLVYICCRCSLWNRLVVRTISICRYRGHFSIGIRYDNVYSRKTLARLGLYAVTVTSLNTTPLSVLTSVRTSLPLGPPHHRHHL
jgi:hypothetical protein